MLERKSFKFEVKSIDEATGTFEGYASVFRTTPDKVGDIVEPGAFKKTINDHNGEIPLFWMHNIMEPVGLAKVEEDNHGLKVHGILTRGVQKADEAHLFLKAGVVKTMSIGFDVVKRELKAGLRHLQELKVPDISLVVGSFAADDLAVITAVKTDTEVAADYPWEQCIADQTEQYGNEETARRVCGAIRAHGGGKAALEKVDAFLGITPKSNSKALPAKEAEPLTSEDREAADILSVLNNQLIDFDPMAAEKRIDTLLAKL